MWTKISVRWLASTTEADDSVIRQDDDSNEHYFREHATVAQRGTVEPVASCFGLQFGIDTSGW